MRWVVARIGADLANGARMGDGGRKLFLLCEGGTWVLADLAVSLVEDGWRALLGNNKDPSSPSSPCKIPDLIEEWIGANEALSEGSPPIDISVDASASRPPCCDANDDFLDLFPPLTLDNDELDRRWPIVSELRLGEGLMIPSPSGVELPLLPMATLCCSPLLDLAPPN